MGSPTHRLHIRLPLLLAASLLLAAPAALAQTPPDNALSPDAFAAGRRWIYFYEQTPASPDNLDESIYRAYPIQITSQAAAPGLNPDEWSLHFKERGGPDETRDRTLTYKLWPSCLSGPISPPKPDELAAPDPPQVCATGETQTWSLDGTEYPVQIYANDTQAIFFNPTLGIVEDAFLDPRQVLVSRRLIGFDFGPKHTGGDLSPVPTCDWHTSQRIKPSNTPIKLKLQGKHGIASEASILCPPPSAPSAPPSPCTISLPTSPKPLQWSLSPFAITFAKAWTLPDLPAHEFITLQAESPDAFAAITLHLSPDGISASQHTFPKPSAPAKAAFSVLLMQQDRKCHIQVRLKQDKKTPVANFDLSAAGVQRTNGSLLSTRQVLKND